ncbi:protein translocase subunit SecD [Candidatus Parcubacteria bacterium]|nr:MAG: protein translocase subunit SecD [Candidatus Parcubacteria bacterium]
MWRTLSAVALLGFVGALGWLVWWNASGKGSFPFRLGLDLAGGVELSYAADISEVPPGEIRDAMRSLRDVLERRVNLFGVAEPVVRVERASVVAEDSDVWRVRVELPGVTDVEEAIRRIGQTPLLEFKLVGGAAATSATGTPQVVYEPTGLTGRFLEQAQLGFSGGNAGPSEPVIFLTFNSEGAELFYEITKNNVGRQLAVFLDGELITDPIIREPIAGGKAQISGSFAVQEAREIARNLNFGALPVPITLIGTQQVGPTLGKEALAAGVRALAVALALVVFFMVAWYRLPGMVAVVGLLGYGVVMLVLFQFIPVVLTAAGIAGFILSLGMAVDANVLVFERLKEELAHGKPLSEAVENAFARAWSAVRDGNVTTLFTAGVLYWLGTSFVEGFALVLALGVLVSMASAMIGGRVFLRALAAIPALGERRALWTSPGI